MGRRNHRYLDYVLLILGFLSITYFILLLCNMSFTKFLLIYPVGAIGCFLYAGIELYTKGSIVYRLPAFFRYFLLSLVLIVVASFVAAQSVIIFYGTQQYQGKSDYVIVLGAQINGDKISTSLQYRLDAALDIYKQNSDTIFIVSGGKGTGENDSEAYYMHHYLSEHGVSEKQIIMETRSSNTYENLLYSKQLLDVYSDGKSYDVTIVTNAFHAYRSNYLAKKIGLNAHTYAASMHRISIPHFYIREYFGLMKDMIINR